MRPLLSDDGSTWLATAALVRAPDADTARAILTPDLYAVIEVHDWQIRRAALTGLLRQGSGAFAASPTARPITCTTRPLETYRDTYGKV